jgi:hypothetical protein
MALRRLIDTSSRVCCDTVMPLGRRPRALTAIRDVAGLAANDQSPSCHIDFT